MASENPLKFEWGGESMIEDKGEIFPSFTIPTEHPGFKQLQLAHQTVHGTELKHGMSTTVTDGGEHTLVYQLFYTGLVV